MRLEDPSSLDSLESRFSIDFQQIVIDFVIVFVITKRVQASYREPTVNRGNEYGRSRWTGAKFQKEHIKGRI